MSDEQGSADTGNPEAPASAPAAAAPAAAAPAAAPAAEAAADTLPLAGFSDPDLRSYAEGKHFDQAGFEGVVKSYRHLEQLFGRDKAGLTIMMLGDDPTSEQTNEFYTKLGRPKTAQDYGLTPPEGQDSAFADWASGIFHEAGLTQKQAEQIAGRWDAYQNDSATTAQTIRDSTAEAAVAELKKEWGAAYVGKVAGIESAAGKLGLTLPQLGALHTALGGAGAMRFVDRLNSQMGEHVHDSGAPERGGAMTPEQAKTAMSEMMLNKDFMSAWLDRGHPGHHAAMAKKEAMSRQIAGVSA